LPIKRHNNLVLEGAIGSLFLKIAQTCLSLFLSIALARILGVKDYGMYSFCIAVISLLTVPSMMGGENLIVREVAYYNSKKKFSYLKGVLLFVNKSTNRTSIIITISGIIVAIFLNANKPLLLPFTIAMLLVPMMTKMNIQSATLRGFKYIILNQLGITLVPAIILGVLIVFYFINIKSYNPNSIIVIHIFSLSVTITLNYLLIKNRTPVEVISAHSKFKKNKWVKSMIPFFITSGVHILNNEASLIILGISQDTESVGLFRVAQRGAMLIPFGLYSVNVALGPMVAELFAKGKRGRLQEVINKGIFSTVAFALPMTLLLIGAGNWLIPIIYGKEYSSAYIILVILSVGQLVNACAGSVGVISNMVGLERYVTRGSIIASICNIFLNLFLIPSLGILGAAIATIASVFVWNFLLALWLYRETGLKSFLHLNLKKIV